MVKQRVFDIDSILGSLEPEQKEIVQNLRALVKSAVPGCVEFVRQGKISYKLGEKDFVWISRFQSHVDLEFFMGASLSSPLFKSRGIAEKSESTRHIQVGNFQKLQLELTRLLKDAEAIGLEH